MSGFGNASKSLTVRPYSLRVSCRKMRGLGDSSVQSGATFCGTVALPPLPLPPPAIGLSAVVLPCGSFNSPVQPKAASAATSKPLAHAMSVETNSLPDHRFTPPPPRNR